MWPLCTICGSDCQDSSYMQKIKIKMVKSLSLLQMELEKMRDEKRQTEERLRLMEEAQKQHQAQIAKQNLEKASVSI